jgi:hypothetical protein
MENNVFALTLGPAFKAEARDLAGAAVAACWLGAAPECSFDYDHQGAGWEGRLHFPAPPGPARRLLDAATVLAGFMARPLLPGQLSVRERDVLALATVRADVLAAVQAAGGDAAAAATVHDRLLAEATILVTMENDRIAAVAARLTLHQRLTARDLRPLMKGLHRTTPTALFDRLRKGLPIGPLPDDIPPAYRDSERACIPPDCPGDGQ